MSIRQIAIETGFSVATVSRALRDDPKVNTQTKSIICTAARSLEYTPNPYFRDMMSTLRHRAMKSYKGNLALLMRETAMPEGDVRLKDVVEGARRRSEELGFSLDVLSLAHTSPVVMQRMLENRGVQGVMIFMPSFSGEKLRLRMRLDGFSCVSLGCGLWLPRLDTVQADYHGGMRMMLDQAQRKFGAGVAAIWNFPADEAAQHLARGAFLTHHLKGSAVANELFISADKLQRESVSGLFKKHDIRCLILGSNVPPPHWLGQVIPEAHWIWSHHPGDVLHYGRMDPQNHLIGEWGVNLLAAKIRLYQMGVPHSPQRVLVPQKWLFGSV